MEYNNHNLFNRVRETLTVVRYKDFKEEVTDKAGISISYLYKIMQEKHDNPSLKVLQAISEWFGCSVSELLDPNYVLQDKGIKCKKSAQDSLGKGGLERIFFDKEAA